MLRITMYKFIVLDLFHGDEMQGEITGFFNHLKQVFHIFCFVHISTMDITHLPHPSVYNQN